ncbi:serine threonine- kinase [Lecanosticta acicola]|uniref:Serine threonine- kinase n=1 Tax=Lecanosticta acicola TaxID=111012 RepID=A0AAI8Z0B8_9PEZI|nr:serine threonine- kinase [Lecanosticta acicola]
MLTQPPPLQLANSYQSLLNEFNSADLTTVGNYQLGRLIGKGSFGKVYLAQHKLTNASKVVLKSAKKDDANLAREIHHHRQFAHPHIARLYEVIVTESLVWLVLEYCPGDELYNHLLKHGRMSADKVQKIFTQLVGAVSYVHAKGCVHRDLKLENILLDKHENVKLVDFGFTREYSGPASYLQTWCGTICYSAPEMLKGEKYAGEKVDVWSLGIILFALLTGELPFDEDDDNKTKSRIIKEEPQYPEGMPEQAKDLVQKLLSKRPLLRPSLGDILKHPWLGEYAPQLQEILKVQQPAPFSTHLEKDVLQRMRSAGVDIDMVIEHVLAQRCDSLAGWWALLLEKEQRKEKRRERKRKEREAEAKSIRRLSAASSRLLAQSNLGEIREAAENVQESPRSRGRRLERAHGSLNALQPPDLPKVTETKTPPPEDPKPSKPTVTRSDQARSRSRPPPPPKDYSGVMTRPRTHRASSRGSQSMLRVVTANPDLLSPSYVPPPQRNKRKFYPEPLRQQLAWVKHFFKEGTIKRNKSPSKGENSKAETTVRKVPNGKAEEEKGDLRNLQRTSTTPAGLLRQKGGGQQRPQLLESKSMPMRPRINTTSSTGSGASIRAGKRSSLSPGTLTPHSSYRRSSVGLRGRKSTSSSVSSVRSTYKGGHQHTHSKASSTSSTSIASPSGLSSASGSRLAKSPHHSVKVLPSTPGTSGFPSGIRFSKRPPPSNIGGLQGLGGSEAKSAFGSIPAPSSPGVPVFARRKRSVFKGPMSGSPHGRGGGAGGSRSASVQGRPSGEMMPGVEEEDEEELEDDDGDYEEVDHFGPELVVATSDAGMTGRSGGDTEPASPLSPSPGQEEEDPLGPGGNAEALKSSGGVPLTAEALAKLDTEEERKDKEGIRSLEMEKAAVGGAP